MWLRTTVSGVRIPPCLKKNMSHAHIVYLVLFFIFSPKDPNKTFRYCPTHIYFMARTGINSLEA